MTALPNKILTRTSDTGWRKGKLALTWFVCVGAFVGLGFLASAVTGDTSTFADRFDLPQKNEIDRSLLIGSFLFGLGWAISGFCPGPAIAGIFRLHWEQAIVILAMVGGFKLAPLIGPKTR